MFYFIDEMGRANNIMDQNGFKFPNKFKIISHSSIARVPMLGL